MNSVMPNLTSQEQKNLIQILSTINEKNTTVSFSNNKIRIYGESGYIYVIEKQGNKYVESYRTKNVSNKNTRTRVYKTKKGKLKSNIKKIISISVFIIGVAGIVSFAKSKNDTNSTQIIEENIIDISDLETLDENKVITITTEVVEEIPETFALTNEPEINKANINIDFEIKQSSRFDKRIETDQLYGSVIKKYEKRWGLPNGLVSALITQERHDSIVSNPGQLTRMICGEKIILPIIEKDEDDLQKKKEVDKIFIVREEPKRENYSKEQDYLEQLEIYRKQLEKSKELQQEGYEIISFPELLDENNVSENIRISAAFLAYYNYKLKDPILSTFAYNAGYTKAKSVNNIYDVLNGLVGSENTDKLYLTHVYRFLSSEEAANLQFITKPFPENFNNMSYEERKFYMTEEIKNTPLDITTISLTGFKEYTNEEEIGSNLRR